VYLDESEFVQQWECMPLYYHQITVNIIFNNFRYGSMVWVIHHCIISECCHCIIIKIFSQSLNFGYGSMVHSMVICINAETEQICGPKCSLALTVINAYSYSRPDPSTAAATAKDIDPPDVNRLCTTTWVLKGYRADRADQGLWGSWSWCRQ